MSHSPFVILEPSLLLGQMSSGRQECGLFFFFFLENHIPNSKEIVQRMLPDFLSYIIFSFFLSSCLSYGCHRVRC